MAGWNYRGFVIYPHDLLEGVANIRQNVANVFVGHSKLERYQDEIKMFDTPILLSSDNGATVTHHALSTMQNHAMYTQLTQGFLSRQGELTGLTWYVVDPDTNELIATNTALELGSAVTFDDVLTSLGLVRYQEALE